MSEESNSDYYESDTFEEPVEESDEAKESKTNVFLTQQIDAFTPSDCSDNLDNHEPDDIDIAIKDHGKWTSSSGDESDPEQQETALIVIHPPSSESHSVSPIIDSSSSPSHRFRRKKVIKGTITNYEKSRKMLSLPMIPYNWSAPKHSPGLILGYLGSSPCPVLTRDEDREAAELQRKRAARRAAQIEYERKEALRASYQLARDHAVRGEVSLRASHENRIKSDRRESNEMRARSYKNAKFEIFAARQRRFQECERQGELFRRAQFNLFKAKQEDREREKKMREFNNNKAGRKSPSK